MRMKKCELIVSCVGQVTSDQDKACGYRISNDCEI